MAWVHPVDKIAAFLLSYEDCHASPRSTADGMNAKISAAALLSLLNSFPPINDLLKLWQC